MVHILRTETGADIPYITYYKKYDPITIDNVDNATKTDNNEYVSHIRNYADFF